MWPHCNVISARVAQWWPHYFASISWRVQISRTGGCAWWCHKMETFFALLVFCAGNSSVPVKSPHKGQWRGDLMFSLICALINGWVNNGEAGDLRRHRTHYDVIVMGTSNLKGALTKEAVETKAWICHYISLLHWRHMNVIASQITDSSTVLFFQPFV